MRRFAREIQIISGENGGCIKTRSTKIQRNPERLRTACNIICGKMTTTTTTPSTAPSNIELRLATLEATLGLPSLSIGAGGEGSDASDAPTSPPPAAADLSSRIERIVSDLNSTVRERQASATNAAASSVGATTSRSSVASASSVTGLEDFAEIDRLMAELDAGSVLSHQGTAGLVSGPSAAQQPLTAPLLYRRQEVLASAEALKIGMDRLGEIRGLLDSVTTSSASAAAQVAAARTSSGGPAKTAGGPSAQSVSTADFANSALITSDRYEYAADADAMRRLQDVSVQAADVNARAVGVATRVDNLISQYHRVMTLLSEKCVLVDEELSVLEMKRDA